MNNSTSDDAKLLDQLHTAQTLEQNHTAEPHPVIAKLREQLQASSSQDSSNDQASTEKTQTPDDKSPQGLTGTRLRSYAFAVLTRREYGKAELIERLMRYAESRDEVTALVEELAKSDYQSDQRVAEMTLASQVRKGKGPARIKMALKAKKIDQTLIHDEIKEIDWFEQAYQLKVKKFGRHVEKDAKLQAKQIRFLMYRGFEMDVILKAIRHRLDDD